MTNYISVCVERGSLCRLAGKVELSEAMGVLCREEVAGEKKDDCVLMFNGYRDDVDRYARCEGAMTRFSTVFIDCDNPGQNPAMLREFKNLMCQFDYWVYETFSSSESCPKFRVILPLDRELEWSGYAKRAIFKLFAKYADEKASWFWSPTRNRVGTVVWNRGGRLFPADVIQKEIDRLKAEEQNQLSQEVVARAMSMFRSQRVYAEGGVKKECGCGKGGQFPADGWRYMPSVKKCLGGLLKGERDSSLNAACYAMKNCGYGNYIGEFLCEVQVPESMKAKFRRQYC